MLYSIKRYRLLCLTCGLLALAGCRKDDLTPPVDRSTMPRSMGDFIANNYDLSLLKAALQKTGLLDSLNAPGPFTFFAPDNKAFNDAGIISPGDFDRMNTDSLRFVLRYHYIDNRYYISDFPQQPDNRYRTHAGPELYVSIGKGNYGPGTNNLNAYVNGSTIQPGTKRNIALANGTMHILRKPLNYFQGTTQDFIAADTSLALFAALMKKCNYWDGLKTASPLTVYAPVNAAFLKYKLTADSISRLNTGMYKPITFGVYTLMMGTNHVFSTDGNAITGGYTYGQDGVIMGMFSVYPYYMFNPNTNQEDYWVAIAQLTTNNQWTGNQSGPMSSKYAGGVNGADKVTSNGILHRITDLLFYPARMQQ